MRRKTLIMLICGSLLLVSCQHIKEQQQIKKFATYYAGHPLAELEGKEK